MRKFQQFAIASVFVQLLPKFYLFTSFNDVITHISSNKQIIADVQEFKFDKKSFKDLG